MSLITTKFTMGVKQDAVFDSTVRSLPTTKFTKGVKQAVQFSRSSLQLCLQRPINQNSFIRWIKEV